MSSQIETSQPSVELWGGVECTINRVGEQYFEQLNRTSHSTRLSDFDYFASLGIKALRQPVLWESVAPEGLENARWDWPDAALNRLRKLGIRPIIGLIHHGSGPRHTSLLDPEFPSKLAQYAEAVAHRYPWVNDYTPVNEPLTTARFSALYGHWYPHHRDELLFARTLLNQCKAVVRSMEAIRRINPSARLVQTDDLSKIFSTPKLKYQADFENERRWCTYDLLCGRVDRSHRMWGHLRWVGVDEADLLWFLDHPCPPEIIGVNHYLSGNRYLDEHLERYPSEFHGSNGRDRYADVLATRVMRDAAGSPCDLLMEAWNRYHLPIAITECHNGCTREEQLRWMFDMWRNAQRASLNGANILAVTAWSLLGAFDWNRLVTQKNDHYEPGVYDVRSSPPRATAIASLIAELAETGTASHPVLDVPGWWHRARRFVYGFALGDDGVAHAVTESEALRGRPVLITGSESPLAQAFIRICELRGITYRAFARHECDITNRSSVHRTLFESQPWAIINAASYDDVENSQANPSRCLRENVQGAMLLARECSQRGIRLLTFSTHMVFDGTKRSPYVESDEPLPINQYGCSKLIAEKSVLGACASALVVRSGPFFSPWDSSDVLTCALRSLRDGQRFRAACDAIVSPTYTPDLVNAALDLLVDYESGMWHLGNSGEISWAGFVETAASLANIPTQGLRACRAQDLQLAARRPLYSALTSERAVLLPSIEDALARFVCESEGLRLDEPEPVRVAA